MAVPKGNPETQIDDGWEREPIPSRPVYLQVEVGRFDPDKRSSLQDALLLVAGYYDANSVAGGSQRFKFCFELDDSLFEVSASPKVQA